MDFSESLKKLKFDKRMIRWNLNQKIISQKDYEAHLKSLSDLAHLQAPPLKEEEEKEKPPARKTPPKTK